MAQKVRVWRVLWLVCATVGCAPSVTPSQGRAVTPAQASRSDPLPVKFQRDLERARSKRREAAALAFVAPADAPSDARIRALGEWLQRRQAAAHDADGAYVAAREQATPAEQVLVERERGELYWELFDATVSSALAIFPGMDKAPPERSAMLRSGLAERFGQDAQKAREHFLACLMHSNQLGLKNADSSRCEEQSRVIDALRAPEKKRDPALEEWQYARLEDASRPRRPVKQTPGCVLSGSAHSGWTRLYTDAGGPEYQVTLTDFDVTKLELPATRGERARISVEYPFKASGYIDLDAGVVETEGRIDLVPGQVWLDPQSDVLAFGADAGQVNIEREGSAKSEPAVALRVSCSKLTLSRQVPFQSHEVQGETSQLSGIIPLFSAPGGKRVAQLDVDSGVNVRVLERRAGWVHVTNVDAGPTFALVPYEFDAWAAEKFAPVGKEGFGIVGMGVKGKPPTHVTKLLLPLRLSPDPNAPIVAELVSGVALLAGAEQNAMRRVRFNQANGHNEGNDFWVTAQDLASRTTPVPAR